MHRDSRVLSSVWLKLKLKPKHQFLFPIFAADSENFQKSSPTVVWLEPGICLVGWRHDTESFTTTHEKKHQLQPLQALEPFHRNFPPNSMRTEIKRMLIFFGGFQSTPSCITPDPKRTAMDQGSTPFLLCSRLLVYLIFLGFIFKE